MSSVGFSQGHLEYDLSIVKRVDGILSFDIHFRNLLTSCALIAIWFIFDLTDAVFLAVTLFVVTMIHATNVQVWPRRVRTLGTLCVFATGFGYGVVWVAGLVMFWLSEIDAVRFVALGGLYLLMIHAARPRNEDLLMLAVDLGTVVLGIVTLPIVSYFWLNDPGEAISVFVTATLIFIFFLYVLREVWTMRRELTQAMTAKVENARIEALGRLTGGVAHDFNNLLTVITGNLDLMKEVEAETEQKVLAEEARLAVARAAQVTAQLLAYARQSVLEPKHIAPDRNIEVVTVLLERLLPEHTTFEVTMQRDLPQIVVDPSRFETVLLNLCINARDAMPDGGVIELSVGAVDVAAGKFAGSDGPLPAGRYLRICVTDDGEGIDAHLLARVSEPYFSTRAVGKGSGLGLSMAKGFVEQSGGAFQIESAKGVGTRVILMFPVPDA